MSWFARGRVSPLQKLKFADVRFCPRLESLEPRWAPYAVSGNSWPGPQLVTLSFMPDGTNLGGPTSNLISAFNSKFGSAATWQNQIIKAAQFWAQQTNINFSVVADNGTASGGGSYQQGDPNFGDIRIGGYHFGSSSALATAYSPPPINNYSIAGDITFNTGQAFNIGSTYDLFTVAVHEIGHATGLLHSSQTAAVEYSSYTGVKSTLHADDISGIRDIYSSDLARSADSYDTSAANGSFSTASNITSKIDASTKAAVLVQLDVTTIADIDYYKFTAPSGGNGKLTAKIISSGRSLLKPKVIVYNSNQAQIGTATGTTNGATVTVQIDSGIVAGQTYYVKVDGADDSAFGTGKYVMTLNMGAGPSPTPPSPNTQNANGTTPSGGGGLAMSVQAQESRVNTFTPNYQETSPETPRAVAIDSQGNYVVTWSSKNQDGDGWGVYAQRYNGLGVAQGSEFRVNTTTTGDQRYSTVAMNANGDFVIAWSSKDPSGDDWNVKARRYNAQGTALGSEFRVNSSTADDRMFPAVAMDALGNFVVTWSSKNQDGSGWGVYGQRFTVLGLPLGFEFLVNGVTSGDQTYTSIAMDALGNFVVAWSSHNQDGDGWSVQARRYTAAGLLQGNGFRVNTTTENDQMYPSVGMNATGDFIITWSSNGQDGSGWGVYGQRYNALGLPQGGEFQVNEATDGDQQFSGVAVTSEGSFIITWSSKGAQNDNWDVVGRQFEHDGAAEGGDVDVHSSGKSGDQLYPSVVQNNMGRIVIAWSGQLLDGSYEVFAQRYAISAHSFEAGDFAPPVSYSPSVQSAAYFLTRQQPGSILELENVTRFDRRSTFSLTSAGDRFQARVDESMAKGRSAAHATGPDVINASIPDAETRFLAWFAPVETWFLEETGFLAGRAD